MNSLLWSGIAAVGAGVAGTLAGSIAIRRKGLHRWLLPYLTSSRQRSDPKPDQPVHLLLAICDHYEPKLGGASLTQARERVRRWTDDYPRLFSEFRDSDGRPPRHTFFFPVEEYEPEFLDSLAKLCSQGFGEVEIHLHHDNDTAENLRHTLISFKQLLNERHGLLSRDPIGGEVAYGFIHGNWALDNSRSDGRWCGVNNELDVLRETGCYADFTFPSAPSETQTRRINSIYYAIDDPLRPKSHNDGIPLGNGPKPERGLLLIQGPLCLDWQRRTLGVLPGIENACLQGSQPPSERRLNLWLRCQIRVPKRPEWYFVKLHTHGANEANMPALLGDAMTQFHNLLRQRAASNPDFKFHYVTARELYNLAFAAETGCRGNVSDLIDASLPPPEVCL